MALLYWFILMVLLMGVVLVAFIDEITNGAITKRLDRLYDKIGDKVNKRRGH